MKRANRKDLIWQTLAGIAVLGPLGMILFIALSGRWPGPSSILLWSLGPAGFSILAGAGVAIYTMLDYRKRVRAAKEDPVERLRRRISRVNDAFAKATTLMDELRRDLEAQQATREALLAEAERQQQLLAINEEEAEKIRQILTNETKETIRAERRREWLFFLLGFAASAAASVPIGIWVNHIS
ncbi:hypothetical protein [Microbispora triticiradicis]|uniref:Uncharacterized protein n=2 Tax=Microbispora TaxID=2005 RepID=A0ABY3LPZ9_9ACTN|nr:MULTISPECIES: hypothetical protein [Microbispora]TLP66534.1 hypothetical protein FED44_03475 [Microbispora fusca]TYB47427.1 hypothetical protein FXF59_29875 [Microbispora tritici]